MVKIYLFLFAVLFSSLLHATNFDDGIDLQRRALRAIAPDFKSIQETTDEDWQHLFTTFADLCTPECAKLLDQSNKKFKQSDAQKSRAWFHRGVNHCVYGSERSMNDARICLLALKDDQVLETQLDHLIQLRTKAFSFKPLKEVISHATAFMVMLYGREYLLQGFQHYVSAFGGDELGMAVSVLINMKCQIPYWDMPIEPLLFYVGSKRFCGLLIDAVL